MSSMISDAMQDLLNDQVKIEFGAEHKYLAIAACCARLGLSKFAEFFTAQAVEEHAHALKFAHYIERVGGRVEFRGVDAPRNDYDTVEEMVQTALDSELFVTRRVNAITALCEHEKDYATRSFNQWFVDEQVEEVETMTNLLNLVRLAGAENLLLVEDRLASLRAAGEAE